MQACPGCGTSFEPLQGGYDNTGRVVCLPCAEQARAASQRRETDAKGSAFIGSLGAFLISFMSIFVEHRLLFFLFPILGIAAGGAIALSTLRNPESAAALGWKRWPTIIVGILAALLGLMSLLAGFEAR